MPGSRGGEVDHTFIRSYKSIRYPENRATDAPFTEIQKGSTGTGCGSGRQRLPAKIPLNPELRMNDEEYCEFLHGKS